MNVLKQAWRGEVKLWKVFWGGVVLPIVILFILILLLILFHMSYGFTQTQGSFILQAIYYIAWCVCVWKCSSNTGNRFWKYTAIVSAVVLTLGVIAATIHKHPAAYNPACVKPMEDFARNNGLNVQDYIASNSPYLLKCTKALHESICKKTMQDFAKNNGLNPDDYVAHNSLYLRQCVQSLEDKEAAQNAQH